MAGKKSQPKTIVNRRARYDYIIGDSLVVGLELTGAEAKSLRLGFGQLSGAYVTIKNNQLVLINATISGNNAIHIPDSQTTRDRRLLAKRKEITKLIEAKQQGKTIVPLELLTGGRFVKLRIALATGKKRYDKRQAIKLRDDERRIRQKA